MGNVSIACDVCGTTSSQFYFAIGDKSICNTCKTEHKSDKNPKFQKPRLFTRYRCTKHNIGTYNINRLSKHEMRDCVIVSETTLGIIRPATYGGYNGDISRKYFLGINELDRLKTNLSNYSRFVFIMYKKRKFQSSSKGKEIYYNDKRYFSKHLRFLVNEKEIDFTKNDEMFKRLNFVLNVYVERINRKYTNQKSFKYKDRNIDSYYKSLSASFGKNISAIKKID